MRLPGRLNKYYLRYWIEPRASYVVSYPKSGRTWLAFLLGSALSQLTGRPFTIDLYMYGSWRPGIPYIVFTHDGAGTARRLLPDKSQFAGRPVVLLVRDPRDVLVSHYFQINRRERRFAGDLSAFIRSPVYGIDWLVDYLNLWAQNTTVPSRFLLVRYEELHRVPVATLAEIVRFFPLPGVTEGHLQFAVTAASFERMQQMEADGVSRDFRLRPTDAGDPESFKVRRGKVGGYSDYLSDDDLSYVNERLRRLAPLYGDYFADVRSIPS